MRFQSQAFTPPDYIQAQAYSGRQHAPPAGLGASTLSSGYPYRSVCSEEINPNQIRALPPIDSRALQDTVLHYSANAMDENLMSGVEKSPA